MQLELYMKYISLKLILNFERELAMFSASLRPERQYFSISIYLLWRDIDDIVVRPDVLQRSIPITSYDQNLVKIIQQLAR